jgi:hypothetical protein
MRSDLNKYPQYLDKRGRFIVEADRYYKHYKSIEVKDELLSGYLDTKNNTYIYYIVNSTITPNISGTATYDLYYYSNGGYTLIQKDLKESLDSETSFIENIEKSSSIVTKERSLLEINSNSINLSSFTSGDSITFSPKKAVKDEINNGGYYYVIGDINTGTTINKIQYIKFEDIKLIHNAVSNVRLDSITYPIFILDSTVNSNCAEIKVKTPNKLLDSEISLNIDGSTSTEILWSKFFQAEFIKPETPENNYYNYSITIKPKVNNEDIKNYNPFYEKTVDGVTKKYSTLIKCCVKFGNLKMNFFVVQRPASTPLKILYSRNVDVVSGNLSSPISPNLVSNNKYKLTLPAVVGKKKMVFTVSDALNNPNYNRWAIKSSSLAEGLYINNEGYIIHSYTEEGPSSRGSICTSIYPHNRKNSLLKEEKIGTFVLERKKTNQDSIDTWEDLLYCNESNEVTVEVYLDKDPNIYASQLFIRSNTPYYYQNMVGNVAENIRLYLFQSDSTTPQEFEILSKKTDKKLIERLSVQTPDKSVVILSEFTELEDEIINGTTYEVCKLEMIPSIVNTNNYCIGSSDGSEEILPIELKYVAKEPTTSDSNDGEILTETFCCVIGPKVEQLDLYTDGKLSYVPNNVGNSEVNLDYSFSSETELENNINYLRAGDIVNVQDKIYQIKADNYIKLPGDNITSYLSLYDGKPGSDKFKHRRNVYLIEPSGNFNCWVINSILDLDLKTSGRSGKLYTINDIQGNKELEPLVISSDQIPYTAMNFEPIRFSRYYNTTTPIEDFRLDWKFKAYENNLLADRVLKLRYDTANSEDIQVASDFYDYGQDNNEFPIDYVGLYRMMIRTNSPCIISVDNSDPEVKFGLFSELTNSRFEQNDKTTVDPGLYGVDGIPIYFYFDGETEGSSITRESKKRFSTKITIQLLQNANVVKELNLVRYYKVLAKNSSGQLSISSDFPEIQEKPSFEVISTNGKLINDEFKKDIFFYDSLKMFLNSRLDLRIERNMYDDQSNLKIDIENNLDINYYQHNRGLISTYISISQPSSFISFPLRPTASLNIGYCNKLGEKYNDNYLLYHLINLKTNYTLSTDNSSFSHQNDSTELSLRFPYNLSSNSERFYILSRSNSDYKYFSKMAGILIDFEKNSDNTCLIDFNKISSTDYEVLYSASISGVGINTDNTFRRLGTANIILRPDPDNFIRDEKDKPRLTTDNDGYSVADIEKFMPSAIFYLNIYQDKKSNSDDPDNPSGDDGTLAFDFAGDQSVISANGETRTINLISREECSLDNSVISHYYSIGRIGGTYRSPRYIPVRPGEGGSNEGGVENPVSFSDHEHHDYEPEHTVGDDADTNIEYVMENSYDGYNKVVHIAVPSIINGTTVDSNTNYPSGRILCSDNKYRWKLSIGIRFRSLVYRMSLSSDNAMIYPYTTGINIEDLNNIRNYLPMNTIARIGELFENDGVVSTVTESSNFTLDIYRDSIKSVLTSYNFSPLFNGFRQRGYARGIIFGYTGDTTVSGINNNYFIVGQGNDVVNFPNEYNAETVPQLFGISSSLGNRFKVQSSDAVNICAFSFDIISMYKYITGKISADGVAISRLIVNNCVPESAEITNTNSNWSTLADVINDRLQAKTNKSKFGNYKISMSEVVKNDAVFRFYDEDFNSGSTVYLSIYK